MANVENDGGLGDEQGKRGEWGELSDFKKEEDGEDGKNL